MRSDNRGQTKAIIQHQHLIHNFNLIRQAVGSTKIMGVVKADAYGHGSLEVAQTLIKAGAEYLGVAFLEEGIKLREHGIQIPILVFGAHLTKYFENHLQYGLDITITSLEQVPHLEEICQRMSKKARVHIKVDTGMGRVGFRFEEFTNHLDTLFNVPFIDVIGVYTHFASADENDLSYTELQLQRFNVIKKVAEQYGNNILFHAANSAAIMRLPAAHLDIVRPGIMLYGNPPSANFPLTWDLKEVMTLISRISLIKSLPPGEPVSYNRHYYTKDHTRIGIIPVGYADGYNRKLTNQGEVLIRGHRFPVIGTVCMDQIVVDLKNDTSIKYGEDVVLFGRQNQGHISITEIARKLETTPYEITCWVSGRVPREHKKMD